MRRAVCAGLVHMLQLQPALLAPQMRDVIQYMLESTQVRFSLCMRAAGFCDAAPRHVRLSCIMMLCLSVI